MEVKEIKKEKNTKTKELPLKVETEMIYSLLNGIKTQFRKPIKEWDSWFKSQEEYSTKRDTFQFKQIHGMYKAYRAYLTTVYGEING